MASTHAASDDTGYDDVDLSEHPLHSRAMITAGKPMVPVVDFVAGRLVATVDRDDEDYLTCVLDRERGVVLVEPAGELSPRVEGSEEGIMRAFPLLFGGMAAGMAFPLPLLPGLAPTVLGVVLLWFALGTYRTFVLRRYRFERLDTSGGGV